jgi:hypothetical protein
MAKKELSVQESGQYLLIFLIILTFFYVVLKQFSQLVRVAVPIATAVAVYKTIKAAEKSDPQKIENKTWRLVAVCLGIWLAGEVSVVVFFIRYGLVPYPSLAEISYLLGYLLMSAGAFTIIRKIDVKLPISHILTFTSVILLMSIAVTNFVITRAIITPAEPMQKVFNIGLPVADMMLFVVVFAIYFVYFGAGKR